MGYRKQQVLPGITTSQPLPGMQSPENARELLEAVLAQLGFGVQVQARVDEGSLFVVAYGSNLSSEQAAAIHAAAEGVRTAYNEVAIEFRLIDLNSALGF